MTPSELVILLPCHSLEDFPHELADADAQGLLAAWSALWHPRLLAAAAKTPRWYRADYPPEDVAARLIVIPEMSQRQLPCGWVERAEAQGAVLIQHQPDRATIVRQALEALDEPDPVDDPELVADFLALGLAYLILELLTRQMRYISNLDEVHLEGQTLAAARAAVLGDLVTAREHLHSTFGVLMEGRERFYPVDSFLLDLTLVAPTTLGSALRAALSGGPPMNIVLTAATLEQMERQEPRTLEALRGALDRGTVSLIGGEYQEAPLPLMSAESIRAELVHGAEVYERILGSRPVVYGRRTAGLVSSLPQILSRLGFRGAIHATLDEGKLPHPEQSKACWQGWDKSSIDAFARLPLDARNAATFVSLPAKLGETMDLDHVATLAFAHWPGDVSPWYDDLKRVHNFVPLFGKFVTAQEFFTQTDAAGRFSQQTPDDYQTPYLNQAVRAGASDPISAHVGRQRDEVRRMAESGLSLLRSALAGPLPTVPAQAASHDETTDEIAQTVTALLTRGGSESHPGTIWVNPFSFSGTATCAKRAGEPAVTNRAVEVPAMGFVWLDPRVPVGTVAKRKAPRPIVSQSVLANEFFEIHIHPETGGIGALRNDRARGNRLSQQLALRLDGDAARSDRPAAEGSEYSVMRADSIQVATNDSAAGQIVSRGRLLDSDQRVLARFEQAVRVTRGSRIAELSIQLEIDEQPQGTPWRSYYACRWAWRADDAELRRSVTGTSQPTEARRMEAPHFVEIREQRARTALLTGGLPYHYRAGDHMLDTLLVVRGERERQFRLGIGVDVPSAEAAALVILGAGPVAVGGSPPPPGHASGWLFWLDGRGTVATHWETIRQAGRGGGLCTATGFRVRILETEGRSGRATLHSFRPIRAARQVDLLGQPLVELRLIDGAVSLDVGAYEWLEVEVEWREGPE